MENGLGCHSLKMPALSQATSNGSSTNGNTTTSSELFCQINDPEDVGAIVTSFCKVIQDGYGQIKKEIVTENEAVLGNCSTNTTNFVNNVNEPVKDEEEEIFDANAGQNGSAAICLQNDEQKIDTHDIKDEENVVCEEEIVNSLKNNEDNLQESKFNVDFLRKRRKIVY